MTLYAIELISWHIMNGMEIFVMLGNNVSNDNRKKNQQGKIGI